MTEEEEYLIKDAKDVSPSDLEDLEDDLINNPKYVKPKDAAKILQVSPSTLHRMWKDYGVIEHPTKPGRKSCYFYVPNLIEYMRNVLDQNDWEMIILQRVLTRRLTSFEATYLRKKKDKKKGPDDVTATMEMSPLLRKLEAKRPKFAKRKIRFYQALSAFLKIVEDHNELIEPPRVDAKQARAKKKALMAGPTLTQ